MAVQAKLQFIRIAPRKMRLVGDAIRGKTTAQAEAILKFRANRAALPLLKLVKSAVANAKHNFNMDEKNLFISKLLIDQGPTLKRSMPRSRGTAYEIQKKMSHVVLEVSEIKSSKKPAAAKKSEAKKTNKK